MLGLGAGCLVDADDRCGPLQSFEDGVCQCVAGATLVGVHCVVMDSGTPPPTGGLGTACSADLPCTNPEYPVCQSVAGGEAYCTKTGCQRASDCGFGFGCATAATPSFCRPPYTGQKAACASDADCAGYDAKYCLTILSVCLVVDCSESSCDPGWSCFDLASRLAGLPTACVENSDLGK